MEVSATVASWWSMMTVVPPVSPLARERRSPEGECGTVELSHGGVLSR
jgi:hypothetical protein